MSQLLKPSPRLRVVTVVACALAAPAVSFAACNIINGKAYGDCQNVTVRHGTKPPLEVRAHSTESAIIAGATVHAGGSLHLTGVANGDILVKKGGRLSVTGVANSTVRNEGGVVEIEGIVGSLISNGGSTVVGGQVGSVAGTGPVSFKKGSVLQGQPLERALRYPMAPVAGAGSSR